MLCQKEISVALGKHAVGVEETEHDRETYHHQTVIEVSWQGACEA
jgi:hypothetical protein